jgi:2-oxoglutarate ferredoxin oxidoreductase subunit gamma
MRTEICISGFGGQGIVLAGYILGKAAALFDGKEAVMTQSYGPEARGGASSANVIISDLTVDFPFVQKPGILVALSQEGYLKFRPKAREGALIYIDRELVDPFEDDTPAAIPATRIAEDLGKRIVANVVMLGFFTAAAGVVTREAMLKSIETTVKPKTLSLNLEAFDKGFAYLNDGVKQTNKTAVRE